MKIAQDHKQEARKRAVEAERLVTLLSRSIDAAYVVDLLDGRPWFQTEDEFVRALAELEEVRSALLIHRESAQRLADLWQGRVTEVAGALPRRGRVRAFRPPPSRL